jgi:FixJ family two-component response regulator
VRAENLGKTAESLPSSVWVLDPDHASRGLVKRLLERHGWQVEDCDCPRTFFDRYQPGRGSCLVLEAIFGEGSGLSVQQELAARGDLLPMVFLAERAEVRTAVAAMKGGAADFLLKPVSPAELVGAVQAAIARWRRYRAMQETAVAARRLQSLTAREREVLELVIAGFSTKQISARLLRVEKTVEFHRQNIMRKIGATNVAHLVGMVAAAQNAFDFPGGNGARRLNGRLANGRSGPSDQGSP